jgi:hypothetical protein
MTTVGQNFNEITRVQIPALVHLSRLGYDYLSTKSDDSKSQQYFGNKTEYTDITAAEFDSKMTCHKSKLSEIFQQGAELEQEIFKQPGFLNFNEEARGE